MKSAKIILGILIVTHLSPVFARSCETLYITIKNQSHGDCVLEKQYVIHGKLFPNSTVPEVIFRDQEVHFKMIGDYSSPELDVLLTYQCGNDQTISFYSRKPESRSIRITRNIPIHFYKKDKSTVVEVKNMAGKFTSELCHNGDYGYSKKPNKINWIIDSLDSESSERS